MNHVSPCRVQILCASVQKYIESPLWEDTFRNRAAHCAAHVATDTHSSAKRKEPDYYNAHCTALYELVALQVLKYNNTFLFDARTTDDTIIVFTASLSQCSTAIFLTLILLSNTDLAYRITRIHSYQGVGRDNSIFYNGR